MKKSYSIILIFISILSCDSAHSQNIIYDSCYLNQVPPADSAIVFAENLFNFPEGYHSSLIFTKDCNEVYFTPMTTKGEIYQMNISNPKETKKLSFKKDFAIFVYLNFPFSLEMAVSRIRL